MKSVLIQQLKSGTVFKPNPDKLREQINIPNIQAARMAWKRYTDKVKKEARIDAGDTSSVCIPQLSHSSWMNTNTRNHTGCSYPQSQAQGGP
jgi:hypothetical protein